MYALIVLTEKITCYLCVSSLLTYHQKYWVSPPPDVSKPEASKKMPENYVGNGSRLSETNVNGIGMAKVTVQRKRLLKAPTLAELDSSDSEVGCW